MIAAIFLIGLGVYLACGLVFAIPFAWGGVKKIDPHAAHGSWGFRLLIIPGAMAFWPLLLKRWLGGVHALVSGQWSAGLRVSAPSARRERTKSRVLSCSSRQCGSQFEV